MTSVTTCRLPFALHRMGPWAALLVLAACASAGPPAPTGPAALANAPRASVAACRLPRFEADLLERINQFRSAPRQCGRRSFAAAPALGWNVRLTQAATGHSADMARHGYFSHTGRDQREMNDRASAAGYAWSALGENIAAGPDTVAEVMAGWQASEGHCANLMNPAFREVGVACVPRPASERGSYDTYWTMVLGRAR
jgi:uncharacterized protein YkwD